MKEDKPKETFLLSIICPTYNEQDFLNQLLHFLAEAKPKNKECFIIDGGSTDRTRAIFQHWQMQLPHLHWIDNPRQYVPFALNLAIPMCSGKYIVRLDAHTEYAPDYFEKILETFEKTDADIVGGPTRTKGRNAFQKAVAQAICDPLAVGNSKVHDIDYEGYTDSVTFGAWKREVFTRTGLFDENLKRNQDDEFHYRAKSLGFSVYQNPDIKLFYYPRDTLKGLFKQYYQYGLYKPRVLKKVRSEIKLRHLVPSLFVAYVVFMPLGLLFTGLSIPLFVYIGLVMMRASAMSGGFSVKVRGLLVYPAIHLAYGLGFIRGLLRS